MGKDPKEAVADRIRWIFGDVAEQIIKIEEERIGHALTGSVDAQEVERLAAELKELSLRMAGPWLADRVYEEVVDTLNPKKRIMR